MSIALPTITPALLDGLLSRRAADGALKLVVLAGAGVSHDEPAGIPLGRSLTHYYLASCLGERVACAMEGRWRRISGEVERGLGVSAPLMRLESVIEKVDDVDREFGYEPLMGGFREFATVEPNAQHRHIASLARRGARVVTPNFDCGIERALDPRFAGPGDGAPQPSYDEALGVYVGDADGCRVYHYHGVGSDPDGLGATVKRMLRGFAPAFAEMLRGWFEEGCSLLCVGFGCVDYFDATQFFEALPRRAFEGQALFCEHSRGGPCPMGEGAHRSRKRFVGGFSRSSIACGPTEELLAALVDRACGAGQAGRDRDAALRAAGRGHDAWKSGFERLLAGGPRDGRMYCIRIMNQFGFQLTDAEVAEVIRGAADPSDPREVGVFERHASCRAVLDAASRDFAGRVEAGGGEGYFLDGERFPTQSRSIGFDIKMLCGDLGYCPEGAERVAALYDSALRARTARDTDVDSRGRDVTVGDIRHEVARRAACGSGAMPTRHIVAFRNVAEGLVRVWLDGGCLGSRWDARLDEAVGCADALAALPLGRFMFSSHRLTVMKAYNLLHVLRGDADERLFPARDLAELAMQICLSDEPPRIYRHEALACMLRLVGADARGGAPAAEVDRWRGELRRWKGRARAYLDVLDVAGAWKQSEPWMDAVDVFLGESSPATRVAREAALACIGDAGA